MKHEIYKDEGYRLMGAAYLINSGSKGGLEWKRFILSDLIAPDKNQRSSASISG